MPKKKRRKYTAEFKDEAVKLVTEQGYKATEAARNLGINVNMLRRWIQEIENPSVKNVAEMNTELRRLRKEVKRLKMEREILKKATAFFAKDQ